MQRSQTSDLSESCRGCKFRGRGFFCRASPEELRDLDAAVSVSKYPQGALLFAEEQRPTGIFQVCVGEVKLSLCSSEGKTLAIRIAGPGDVLGLRAALSDAPYEATAESLGPCQVGFLSSNDFRKHLHRYPAVFQRVASHLGLLYGDACEQLSMVGLGASVRERLCRFLLNWSAANGAAENGSPFTLSLSQQDIAESIGVSRESVARTLGQLKNKGLIETYRGTFTIPDRAALREASHISDETTGERLTAKAVGTDKAREVSFCSGPLGGLHVKSR